MTLIEFFSRKNEIVHKETGLTLIPQDQIIDINPQKIGRLHITNDSGCSPYCIFNVIYDDGFEDCSQCPLEQAGNGCGDKNSSYQRVFHHLIMQGRRIHELSAIQDLIEQWNHDLDQEKRANHARSYES